jgi:cellulose synthase/poly-beta-1,6-N-acetylglucosamine synthase-like glycosyltransferase
MLIQVVYLLILLNLKAPSKIRVDELPTVSVLVAARNEASNILRCLRSLYALDYPVDKIEILIGNDQSTDYTQMIVENFIKDKPHFRLINLSGNEYRQTRGKARVLATLAEQAKGDYFLITDADISVPEKWAKSMIRMMLGNNADMCGGTTNISADKLFEQFQQVDWIYFMGLIHAFASIGRPLTVVGNNMGISRKAYEATGGYPVIPFSITEDYALFNAVRKKGFKVVQKMSPSSMVYSKPIEKLKGVLKQRKRWLTGGWDLPLYYHIMIAIFGAWYFALPVLFWFDWKLALTLLITKEFIQLFQILKINKQLGIKAEHKFAVLFYDVYLFVMVPLTSVYFLLPLGNTWKGRKY